MKCWVRARRYSDGHLEPQSDFFQRQSEATHRRDGAVLGGPDEVFLTGKVSVTVGVLGVLILLDAFHILQVAV